MLFLKQHSSCLSLSLSFSHLLSKWAHLTQRNSRFEVNLRSWLDKSRRSGNHAFSSAIPLFLVLPVRLLKQPSLQSH
ncbi:unnamed protein product [Protopolystoma xenopodis]|uniref:Uncharacterized protein n=1 Tax=Protopolystoma xenopodis TaxID=117903 RepID=A0A3S5C439_9PLAT|nr:unnamed protein product [Protopolystoma xenopodis]